MNQFRAEKATYGESELHSNPLHYIPRLKYFTELWSEVNEEKGTSD